MTPRVSAEQDKVVVEWLCAVAEPTRLAVLRALARGPKSIGELSTECGVPQTNMSHHVAVLKQHGIITVKREGTSQRFRLAGACVRGKMLELSQASGAKVAVPLG
jgi:DNA-binding transcriptional ArsR family regulator